MIFIIMGVSGCGKTTVGQELALQLNLPFHDADDFHSQSNTDKMRNGIPLTDDDRMPWLQQLAANIRKWEKGGGAVLACSALKENYRKVLQIVPGINWIYLSGAHAVILERLQSRKEHYMSAVLLDSQFAALEEPVYGIHVDVSLNPEQIVQEIITKTKNMQPHSEFGLIGLGIMGKSLALNLASKGVNVAIYNRHVAGTEEAIAGKIIAENPALSNLKGFDKLDEFIQSLARPRKLMLMIYAGAVDQQLEELITLLEPGDVIIDGGNSNYKDTARRTERLAAKEIHYVGTGISGGEEGARKGPSIMAGGSERGYVLIAKYLDLIAAKDKKGNPCAAYIGPGGAGHFVKMVHNGIEYAEMQAIAEVYDLLKNLLKMPAEEIAGIFLSWREVGLESYLLEISTDILMKKEGNELLLDRILDQAEQKGTGGLSVAAALEYGVPYGPLAEAVMVRSLSAMKTSRIKAAALYHDEYADPNLTREDFIAALKNAYQAARIINHEIGFNLMLQASEKNQWDLDLSRIAAIWTNGCIIRSALMEELGEVLKNEESILASPIIVSKMKNWRKDFANMVAMGLQHGYALPVLSAALNYFLGYIRADSPANLIQAQRDYFGAHTYQRTDKPASQNFHTVWKPL